jgi:hypothetical protein
MLEGSCHCGNLRLWFETAMPSGDTAPRACDCSFCTAHGAAWLSDPAGELVVRVGDATALARYRQGSGSAQFLLCRECGVLVAVVFDDGGGLRGAVNLRCLQRASEFAAETTVSPQQLPPEQRRARWQALWIPRARIEGG